MSMIEKDCAEAPICADDARALWLAVLAQGLRDAAGPSRTAGQSKAMLDLQEHQAKAWIGSRHFHTVCALAGVDPEYALRMLPTMLERAGDAKARREMGRSRGASRNRRAAS